MFVNRFQHLHIIVGGTYEEGIVHMACSACDVLFLLKSLESGCLRTGVWHVEERCHSAECRRTALAFDVGLMRKAWLAEMDVVVDDARHCHSTVALNHLCIANGWRFAREYVFDTVISNED